MSRFLGPIHHWLFKKIKHYENLELSIIEDIEKQLGEDISEIVSQGRKQFGNLIPDRPLEDLIDTDNIHGWLQSKITMAETRQAYLITKLINQYGENALKVIENTYENQGSESGKDAKENYDVSSPSELYGSLNHYILDGMPCDQANNVTINKEDHLQWKVQSCLHKGYWENVNGDLKVLYNLRKKWILNFIKSANPTFIYNFKIEELNGQKILVHEIIKSK